MGHFAKTIKEMWTTEVYATELKREHITVSDIKVEEVDLDCDPLPFPDNFFDNVTCIEVIEHMKNPWFVVGEINRVLKPGAKLILSTPLSTYILLHFQSLSYC